MPETRPPIQLSGGSLAELAEAVGAKRLPPVDQWHPTHCGDSQMRIAADGTWYHMGSPIDRPPMVRLFATVLRRDSDGSHVLVTPAEKLAIEVEVTPFRAIAMVSEGEGERRTLAFDLDHGDAVILGPDHPLTIVETAHGPSPRLAVRGGLEALIVRPVYYDLAAIALAEGHDPLGVWSNGAFFALDQ